MDRELTIENVSENVFSANIDSYIRQEKKKGVKEMYWPGEQFELLTMFVEKNGYTMPDFMGIRHYKERAKG